MVDTVTFDPNRVNGLDVLTYFAEYGQHFPEGHPYGDLEAVVARWGAEGFRFAAVDRMIAAWLAMRHAGVPDAPVGSLALVQLFPSLDDESAPSGAGVDAPGDT